jgi:hypothetical protein
MRCCGPTQVIIVEYSERLSRIDSHAGSSVSSVESRLSPSSEVDRFLSINLASSTCRFSVKASGITCRERNGGWCPREFFFLSIDVPTPYGRSVLRVSFRTCFIEGTSAHSHTRTEKATGNLIFSSPLTATLRAPYRLNANRNALDMEAKLIYDLQYRSRGRASFLPDARLLPVYTRRFRPLVQARRQVNMPRSSSDAFILYHRTFRGYTEMSNLR